MANEDAPEGSTARSTVTGDRLRDINEQLTLRALQAQEQIEQSAQRYQGLSEANQLLVKKQQQLRSLASQLTLVEQRERKRLATELHDYLAQMIVLGRLKIGQERNKMAGTNASYTKLINDLDEIFSQALSYTRTLMADLSPNILQQFGLPPALAWLGEQMQKHGLNVEVVLSDHSLQLPNDQAMLLYQSVRELLLNIVKHAGTDHALVTLSVRDGATLLLSVQDQGQGFDQASLETTSAAEHFGLLSVRERMQAMGGWLQMDSAPSRGTTMTLGLPLTTAVQPNLDQRTESTSQTLRETEVDKKCGMCRVLLVDDHAMVRQGLRAILSRYPDLTIIGEAGNGVEAVALAATLVPDVIVMDINMPHMDGIEATTAIKAARPTAIVIALSVDNSAPVMEAMKKAGVATFLCKETAAEHLYDAIVSLSPACRDMAD